MTTRVLRQKSFDIERLVVYLYNLENDANDVPGPRLRAVWVEGRVDGFGAITVSLSHFLGN